MFYIFATLMFGFIGEAWILASASAFSLLNILFWMMQTNKIPPHGDRWKRKDLKDVLKGYWGPQGPRGHTLRTADPRMVSVTEDVCSRALLTGVNVIKSPDIKQDLPPLKTTTREAEEVYSCLCSFSPHEETDHFIFLKKKGMIKNLSPDCFILF